MNIPSPRPSPHLPISPPPHQEGFIAAGSNYGIWIQNNSVVPRIDTVTISLTGTGGSGTNRNYDLVIQGNNSIDGTNSKVYSQNGDITIIGNGKGTGNNNAGVGFEKGGILESTKVNNFSPAKVFLASPH